MSTFNVTARKSGDWWALTVEGPGLSRPAHTQVHHLDQAEDMVRDLLVLLGVPLPCDFIVAAHPDSGPRPPGRNRLP